MFHVKEIAFTGYPVTDMKRARAFYEGVLHLKTGSIWEDGDKAWVEYDIGPGTLAISNMAPDWKPSASGPSIALEVSDLDAALKAVRDAGAKIVMEPADSPVCRMCVLLDPEGNGLVLHQRKAG